MIMKNVCEIRELSNNDSAKSIHELVRETAQPWEEKAVAYLKKGTLGAVAPAILFDVISGERIPMPLTTMNDGEFFWRSDLVYYVEKYHIELPSDFLSKILAL